MRFDIKPKPNLGDKKRKIKFAFFPVKISETKKIWLERYYQHYIYAEVMNYDTFDYGYHGEWCLDYKETLDYKYSSKIEDSISTNQDDIEKRSKILDDILSRI